MFHWLARRAFQEPYRALVRKYRARRNRRLRRWAEMAVLSTLDRERGKQAQELQLANRETERVQRLLDSTAQALKEAQAKMRVDEVERKALALALRRDRERIEKEIALEAGAKALAEHGVSVLSSRKTAAPSGYVSTSPLSE